MTNLFYYLHLMGNNYDGFAGVTHIAKYGKQLVGFLGIEDCGVCKAVGEENKKAEKMAEIKAWAAKL